MNLKPKLVSNPNLSHSGCSSPKEKLSIYNVQSSVSLNTAGNRLNTMALFTVLNHFSNQWLGQTLLAFIRAMYQVFGMTSWYFPAAAFFIFCSIL